MNYENEDIEERIACIGKAVDLIREAYENAETAGADGYILRTMQEVVDDLEELENRLESMQED